MTEFQTQIDWMWLGEKTSYDNYDWRIAAPDGFRFIPLKFSRTLQSLGIPTRRTLRGFSGGGRYGYSPTISLAISEPEYTALVAHRRKTAEKRAKAAAARKVHAEQQSQVRERLACSLGVLPDSRTFASFLRGEIDESECRRIGKITRHRHENTNYEQLLAAGWTKDDARACME